MRVIECNECGEPLTAVNDQELTSALAAHLSSEHGEEPDVDEVAELVEEEAYEAMDS